MTTSTVLTERDGKVGIITLNRPESLHALNAQLNAELEQAIRGMDEDPSIGVLVVTGAGNRAFCAGGDIKEMVSREERAEAERENARRNPAYYLALSRKPTIAAVNGVAIGGGAHLASAVDIRVGCERSLFRFPSVGYGRVSAAAGRANILWTLPLIVGLPKAMELLFTARTIEAEEALTIGLLNLVVPSDQLMVETLKMGHAIAAHPPQMVQLAKELIHRYIGMRLPELEQLEQELRGTLPTPPPARDAFKDFLTARGGAPEE